MIIKRHPYWPIQVSDTGKVWTLDDEEIKVKLNYKCGRVPMAVVFIPGLKRLSKDGKHVQQRPLLVKKLVAETFFDLPDWKYIIYTKDGNESNCCTANLELRPLRDVVSVNIKKCQAQNAKRISIDNIEYGSIRDAAKALAPVLHYSVNTIAGYISRTINNTQLPGDKKFAEEHKIELCDT